MLYCVRGGQAGVPCGGPLTAGLWLLISPQAEGVWAEADCQDPQPAHAGTRLQQVCCSRYAARLSSPLLPSPPPSTLPPKSPLLGARMPLVNPGPSHHPCLPARLFFSRLLPHLKPIIETCCHAASWFLDCCFSSNPALTRIIQACNLKACREADSDIISSMRYRKWQQMSAFVKASCLSAGLDLRTM